MKGETPANPELVEAMARAAAKDIMRQDTFDLEGEDPFPHGGLSWSYIDQGHVDFGEVATACLQALSKAGWVVVPREPSEAMLDAGWTISDRNHRAGLTPSMIELWNAMLSAGEG